MLTQYNKDLSFLIQRRIQPNNDNNDDDEDEKETTNDNDRNLLPRLNEMRVALQKLRPIEKKMAYSINKLSEKGAAIAEEGIEEVASFAASKVDGDKTGSSDPLDLRANASSFLDRIKNQGKEEKKLSLEKKKKKDSKKNSKKYEDESDDSESDDSDDSSSDDNGLASANAASDSDSEDEELKAVRNLVSNKVTKSTYDEDRGEERRSGGGKSSENSELYSAPRMSSVMYDGDKAESKEERKRKKDLDRMNRSEVLQNLRQEFSDKPEEEGIDGISSGRKTMSGGGSARGSHDKLNANRLERERFEEERFVRLVESKDDKKLKKKLERDAMSINNLTDFGSFADSVAKFDRVDKGNAGGGRRGDDGFAGDEGGRHSNGKRIRGSDITEDQSKKRRSSSKSGGKKNDLQQQMFGGGGGGGNKRGKR